MSIYNQPNDKEYNERSSVQDLPNFSEGPVMNRRTELATSSCAVTGGLSDEDHQQSNCSGNCGSICPSLMNVLLNKGWLMGCSLVFFKALEKGYVPRSLG